MSLPPSSLLLLPCDVADSRGRLRRAPLQDSTVPDATDGARRRGSRRRGTRFRPTPSLSGSTSRARWRRRAAIRRRRSPPSRRRSRPIPRTVALRQKLAGTLRAPGQARRGAPAVPGRGGARPERRGQPPAARRRALDSRPLRGRRGRSTKPCSPWRTRTRRRACCSASSTASCRSSTGNPGAAASHRAGGRIRSSVTTTSARIYAASRTARQGGGVVHDRVAAQPRLRSRADRSGAAARDAARSRRRPSSSTSRC